MILRLIFAVALILGGSGIAVVNSALADNSGFGIQLGINAPPEQNTDRPGGISRTLIFNRPSPVWGL